jgi:UDP-N-acetylmuramate dehydrogenase
MPNRMTLSPLPNLDRDVPLAPLTTIGIGGPARFFTHARAADEVIRAVQWARDNGQPLLLLGGGSNMLIADEGFDGLVVHLDLRGVTVESSDAGSVHVKVAAGEPWDAFVDLAVRNGWSGIECLSGIPGSCGATPIQNVGAYGQEVSETIVRVEAIDRESGTVRWFTNAECEFGYRHSIFKGSARDRYAVLSVTFRLIPGGAATIRYPELRDYLAERHVAETDLRGVRDAVIAVRKRKGMVLDPLDPDSRSDGSFFINPIVSASELEAFLERARAVAGADAKVPRFPAADGTTKLSAAWLIEHAGFTKGFVHGHVGLSTKHTLAIVNRSGGTAREVRELVAMIQSAIRERFGIEIKPEPNFIGFID